MCPQFAILGALCKRLDWLVQWILSQKEPLHPPSLLSSSPPSLPGAFPLRALRLWSSLLPVRMEAKSTEGFAKQLGSEEKRSLKAIKVAGAAPGSRSCYAVGCQRLGGSSGESHALRLAWPFCSFSLKISAPGHCFRQHTKLDAHWSGGGWPSLCPALLQFSDFFHPSSCPPACFPASMTSLSRSALALFSPYTICVSLQPLLGFGCG